MTFLNNDTIWRGLAVFLLTVLIGIGGWGLLEVTAMPKVYTTKEAVSKQRVEISKQICDLKKEFNSKIDSASKDIHDRIDRMENRSTTSRDEVMEKLEKINDLLIEHMVNIKKNKKIVGD